jgi:hypothetical protein
VTTLSPNPAITGKIVTPAKRRRINLKHFPTRCKLSKVKPYAGVTLNHAFATSGVTNSR